jgi:hypothetical protein
MSAETIAFGLLSGAPSVTALVVQRIYPDFVPTEQALPAIAFQRAETEYLVTLHDLQPVFVDPVLEVWCMASTRKDAESLADVVLPVLWAGGFRVVGRRPEFEEGPPSLYAAVLSVEIQET